MPRRTEYRIASDIGRMTGLVCVFLFSSIRSLGMEHSLRDIRPGNMASIPFPVYLLIWLSG